MTCTNDECARLRDEIRAALRRAMAELDTYRARRTLGGPARPYTTRSARTSGTTERNTP